MNPTKQLKKQPTYGEVMALLSQKTKELSNHNVALCASILETTATRLREAFANPEISHVERSLLLNELTEDVERLGDAVNVATDAAA